MKYFDFGFFDKYDSPQDFIRNCEERKARCYVDPDSGEKMCYFPSSVKTKKTSRSVSRLSLLYKDVRDTYDEENGYVSVADKSRNKKRLDGIRQILKYNIEKQNAFREEMERYSNEDIDLFLDGKECEEYHNLHNKNKLFYRKAYFNKDHWTHYFTVTYNDKLFSSEEQFKKVFCRFIGNNCFRKGVRIIGCFERGKDTERLHFHGIGVLTPAFLASGFVEVKRYSIKKKKWTSGIELKEISEKFGNNDFQSMSTMGVYEFNKTLGYISKYIAKDGGKMYYSRGLDNYSDQYVNFDFVNFYVDDGRIKYVLDDEVILGRKNFIKSVMGAFIFGPPKVDSEHIPINFAAVA